MNFYHYGLILFARLNEQVHARNIFIQDLNKSGQG